MHRGRRDERLPPRSAAGRGGAGATVRRRRRRSQRQSLLHLEEPGPASSAVAERSFRGARDGECFPTEWSPQICPPIVTPSPAVFSPCCQWSCQAPEPQSKVPHLGRGSWDVYPGIPTPQCFPESQRVREHLLLCRARSLCGYQAPSSWRTWMCEASRPWCSARDTPSARAHSYTAGPSEHRNAPHHVPRCSVRGGKRVAER